ncbi:TPA: bifunctional hydroxymethylpyrimidine kinase/phosphomethylpyrimidine kinase [Candidatus Poribacteria bacterium]|nr:bifunctional hydroxymethylpyrimidine kinase/phosphomethylpyrimidine kinase [Candidatus Poribacteria bacterium]
MLRDELGRPPVAMTIAGSDSGGGAGIQADLKTFASLGVFGCSVITSLTAQNTREVLAIFDLPVHFIASQFEAILSDISVEAAKTGMLSRAETIEVVAEKVDQHEIEKLVVDPVMIATSGDRLLSRDAESVLINKLLPMAMILTPNIFEAEILSGVRIKSADDMRSAAKRIKALGPKFVLIKGGHLKEDKEDAVDILYDGERFYEVRSKRVKTDRLHGAGCTFSSAITAYLAMGYDPIESVYSAKRYIHRSILGAMRIGSGGSVLEWRSDYGEDNGTHMG